MSFLDDTIITEIYLKNGKVLRNCILRNYPKREQSQIEESYDNFTFNLVKFTSTPFPGFILYIRNYLRLEDTDFPEIEEKYVGFVAPNEIYILRLMEISDLKEEDKTLLLIED